MFYQILFNLRPQAFNVGLRREIWAIQCRTDSATDGSKFLRGNFRMRLTGPDDLRDREVARNRNSAVQHLVNGFGPARRYSGGRIAT